MPTEFTLVANRCGVGGLLGRQPPKTVAAAKPTAVLVRQRTTAARKHSRILFGIVADLRFAQSPAKAALP